MKLTRRGGNHDLFERRHALSALPKVDQRPTAEVLGRGHQVRLGNALAEGTDLIQRAAGSRWIAGHQLVRGCRIQHIAPLDAIHATLNEQTARSRPPAARLRYFAGENHAVAGPE